MSNTRVTETLHQALLHREDCNVLGHSQVRETSRTDSLPFSLPPRFRPSVYYLWSSFSFVGLNRLWCYQRESYLVAKKGRGGGGVLFRGEGRGWKGVIKGRDRRGVEGGGVWRDFASLGQKKTSPVVKSLTITPIA